MKCCDHQTYSETQISRNQITNLTLTFPPIRLKKGPFRRLGEINVPDSLYKLLHPATAKRHICQLLSKLKHPLHYHLIDF